MRAPVQPCQHGQKAYLADPNERELTVVALGVILLIVGLLVDTGLPLTTIGLILIVVGLILNFVPIRNGRGIRVF